ncbi:MAG: hypothetical protein K9L30_00125 [Desulfobacterales bacterium]|nr:hypothetical protein [Desulfobacterales bacterium]
MRQAVIAIFLVMWAAIAFAEITDKTSTQTAPLPSNTQTVPLPSNTMEYQQVDKPPVKKLEDIPNWDLAVEFRDTRLTYHQNATSHFRFYLAIMNKGTRSGVRDIPVLITILNVTNNTLIREITTSIEQQDIRNNVWRVTPLFHITFLTGEERNKPRSINDVKIVVEIDPQNTFGEARSDRRNNRCVATW